MCVGRSHSYQVILRHKRDVLQLNSDTIYVETESDPQVKGSVLQD